jgi:hypothetical protein
MKINCMEICESKAGELLPEILERLDDHCLWCADCDWQNNPDQECRFGELWKNLRADKVEYQIEPYQDAKICGKFHYDTTQCVISIEHLQMLADERRSVYVQPIGRLPAAVVINWQAVHLLKLIKNHDITIVQKPQKSEELLPAFRVAIYNHCLNCARRSAVGCGFPAKPDKSCAYGKLIIQDRKLQK